MIFKLYTQSEPYVPDGRESGPRLQTRGRFLAWYQTLVLSLAMGVIFSNLPIYAYILNPGLLPKYAYFSIFLLMTPLVLMRSRSLGAYLMSPFFLWAALLLVLNLIHLLGFSTISDWGGISLIDNQIQARRSLIATRAQYILFSILLGFVVYTAPRKSYLFTLVFLMILLPCAVIFDFAQPGTLYPLETEGAVLGRAAAMFINPTMAGEAILLVFLLGCAVTSTRYRVPLFLLCGAGTLATFSRSSIIAWLLILPILVFKKTLPKSTIITMAVVLGLCLIFVGAFENYLNSRQELDAASDNILSRLNFFSNFKFDDDSSEERADVIRAGWELFLQDPVFGAGAGATQFWSQRGSTHNQLLLFAAEYGILGIGMWMWLLIVLWNGRFFEDRGLQLAMVFMFAFMSLFTHQMLDGASYWLATFATISVRRTGTGVTWPGRMKNHQWQGMSPK
jgi:O-antigen ligase